MQRFLLAVFVFVVSAVPAFATDTRPSEDSIRQLLVETEASALLDSVMGQVDQMMESSMRQALQGQAITEKQRKVINAMQAKTVALMREELKWQTLEPIYIRIYQDSLTQEEVDGMLAFYRTPSGQALVRKMPLIVQNTMTELQKQLEPFTHKLLKLQQETSAELRRQGSE